jgi:hypothetical protein
MMTKTPEGQRYDRIVAAIARVYHAAGIRHDEVSCQPVRQALLAIVHELAPTRFDGEWLQGRIYDAVYDLEQADAQDATPPPREAQPVPLATPEAAVARQDAAPWSASADYEEDEDEEEDDAFVDEDEEVVVDAFVDEEGYLYDLTPEGWREYRDPNIRMVQRVRESMEKTGEIAVYRQKADGSMVLVAPREEAAAWHRERSNG